MTNQLIVKMVLDGWNAQVQNANKLFNELSDTQFQNEIAPGRNRGIYLLGHLIVVNDKMLPLLGFGPQLLPQLDEVFLSKPDKSVGEIPKVDELKKQWNTSVTELSKHFNSLNTEEWFTKHTAVSEEDFKKEPHRNKLNVIMSRTGHLTYHLGQLNLLKK